MSKKLLTFILVVLLLICACPAAFCEELEEEWPEGDWYGTEDSFDDEDDSFPYESNITAWYDALDVYDMFVNCPADINYDQQNSDGTMYLVIDERFTSMQDLIDFAQFFFSDEIAQKLLAAGMYKEEDGHLYARDILNYLDENIGDIEIVSNEQEDRVDYEVTVSYFEPNASGQISETFYFVRELFEDEWRFTAFPYFG